MSRLYRALTEGMGVRQPRGRHAKPRSLRRRYTVIACCAGLAAVGVPVAYATNSYDLRSERDARAVTASEMATAGPEWANRIAFEAKAERAAGVSRPSLNSSYARTPGPQYLYTTGSGVAPAYVRPDTPTVCLDGKERRLPTASSVSLRVFNSTTRYRLAASTAWLLTQRGFGVTSIANDPLGRSIQTAGSVYFGKAGRTEARLLKQHVPGVSLVRDQRTDSSVDLVLGWQFNGLASPEQAEVAVKRYEEPREVNCQAPAIYAQALEVLPAL